MLKRVKGCNLLMDEHAVELHTMSSGSVVLLMSPTIYYWYQGERTFYPDVEFRPWSSKYRLCFFCDKVGFVFEGALSDV